jgi:hypothetical protein
VGGWNNKFEKCAQMLKVWHDIGYPRSSEIDGTKLANQARGDRNAELWKSAENAEHRKRAVAQATADVNGPRKYLISDDSNGENDGESGGAKASSDRKAPEIPEGNNKASSSSAVQNEEDKKSGSSKLLSNAAHESESAAADINIASAPGNALDKHKEEQKEKQSSGSSSSDDSSDESGSDENDRKV